MFSDAWEQNRLGLVPEPWRDQVARGYARKMARADAVPMGQGKRTRTEQAANGWLTEVSGLFEKVRFAPGVTEGDIRDKAAQCAAEAMSLAEIVPGVFVPDVAALRARLERFAATYGVSPPVAKIKDGPAVSRLTCPLWWRRGLRVAQARALEHGAIALEYVHRKAQIYASDATVVRRQEQRRRNAAMLADTTARNMDTGDEFTLSELAAVSVANPAIRRGELLTRVKGFESIARGLGHVAEFVTLTCPSRFHRMRRASNGYIESNKKHDGSSPRDAQKYLTGLWAKLRAKLARMGLRVYGFRIAEPHHDACPHWHLLLFFPPMMRDNARALPRFRAVFRRYALADSGEEEGAQKYRVKFDAIDIERGSATGYLVKYIAKNIDGSGYEVQGDIEGGNDAVYPGQRVEAWASTWGIRQFQQVGGPPVGVWRELRRMREPIDGGPEVLEAARVAADAGEWGRFIEVMGGPVVARAALPLRAAYTEPGERINARTGEIQTGKQTIYGEDAPGVVYGLRYWDKVKRELGLCAWVEVVEMVAASTRYQWEILRGGDAGTSLGVFFGGNPSVPVGTLGGGFVVDGAGVLGVGKGEARAARTRVNNCTGAEPAFLAGRDLLQWKEKNQAAWEAMPPELKRAIGEE